MDYLFWFIHWPKICRTNFNMLACIFCCGEKGSKNNLDKIEIPIIIPPVSYLKIKTIMTTISRILAEMMKVMCLRKTQLWYWVISLQK